MASGPGPCLRRLTLAVFVMLVGCQRPAVVWHESVTLRDTPPLTASLSLAGTAGPTFLPQLAPATHPPAPVPCPFSSRYAVSESGAWYAVWWTARPDSSAALWAARSDDGGSTWNAAHIVDSTDVSVSGCRRAPPSIAASGDYVHVAYSMLSNEGPGVFFAHSMDRGGLFHSPVPIAYGERLGATGIAAHGDRVVVAYEDPNGENSRVALAISATMGHSFERRIAVSGENGEAVTPQVALAGNSIAVSWDERAGTGASVRVARVVRTGEIQ
jgi:hypothetical protein